MGTVGPDGLFPPPEVIAVKGGIQLSQGYLVTGLLLKVLVDTVSQENAPWLEAQDNRLFEIVMVLYQLLSEPADGNIQQGTIKYKSFLHKAAFN